MKIRKTKIEFDVLTIFPQLFDSFIRESLIGRAIKKGIIKIKFFNIRDFSKDGRVDDRPFGGGPGMVMKIEPIDKAVKFVLKKKSPKQKTRIILFSTRGEKLNSKNLKRFLKYDKLILICGRYEGVDERVAQAIADEEISIGDYILSGGELAAMVFIESLSRYLKGFLGKEVSLEEAHGSYRVYTRPEKYKFNKRNLVVPKILLSGDHKKISSWRAKFGKKIE